MKYRATFVLSLVVASVLGRSARAEEADLRIGGARFQFAGIDQARQVLTNRDDFVSRLSQFDRSARMKSAADVSEAAFLAFVATNILVFEKSEIVALSAGIRSLRPKLESLNLTFPNPILLIKATGAEEGNAAYTRSNAIIFPRSKLAAAGPSDASANASLETLIAHELFHILSRHDPVRKEKLYAAIGFHRCHELAFPPSLVRITNPDAPKNDHWIRVKHKGIEVSAIPILFASPSRYDVERGGEFFNYLQFKLLVIQASATGEVKYDSASPQLLDPAQVQGFFEQVGRNTQYIIHPEEILADNFRLLVGPDKNQTVKSPEILSRLKAALTD